MSVNKCIFKGNLGQDPDLRFMPNGREVCNISIACGERWKDKNTGKIHEQTEWIRAVAFGGLAKVIAEHFKKGSEIYIEGKMRTRKYQDKDGSDRYSTEIVADTFDFCGGRSSGNGDQKAQQQSAAYDLQSAPAYGDNPPASAYEGAMGGDQFDDDIPFASLNWQIKNHLI